MQNIDFLEQQAVDAAVRGEWDKAIELNLQIAEQDQTSVSTYLRLGFAAIQSKKIADAKKYYKKVLQLQPTNTIAKDQLEKVSILEEKKSSLNSTPQRALNPNLFLEFPGKTKNVKLVNLGQKEELAELSIGQEVDLKLKKRRIEVRSKDNEYIGCLPDDVSKRLMFFLQENSTYRTYIKETSLNDVSVFVKEESKGEKVAQYPSFPQNPNNFMSDINHDESGENDEDDDEEGDEWIDGHEEHAVEEKDEDLQNIHHEDDDDDVEEE